MSDLCKDPSPTSISFISDHIPIRFLFPPSPPSSSIGRVHFAFVVRLEMENSTAWRKSPCSPTAGTFHTRNTTLLKTLERNLHDPRILWYRLSRQKWTNVERELSSMRKETCTDQIDRQKTAFCSLTTDDIAHNCKTGNSLSGHFLPLKPFDSL